MILYDLFEKFNFEEVYNELLKRGSIISSKKDFYEQVFVRLKNTKINPFANENNILVAKNNLDGILTIYLYYKEYLDIDINNISYEEFLEYIDRENTPNALFEYTPFEDLLRIRILESSFSIITELDFLCIVLERIVKVYKI